MARTSELHALGWAQDLAENLPGVSEPLAEQDAQSILSPLGVLSCGGRANMVSQVLRSWNSDRGATQTAAYLAVDTEAAALEEFEASSRLQLGRDVSAPQLARQFGRRANQRVAEATEPYLLAKSGELTVLGSNQVPAAANALARNELGVVYHAVQALVARTLELRDGSPQQFAACDVFVVVSSANGAVGRGTGLLMTNLVRNALIEAKALSAAVVYHVDLHMSSFSVPSAMGARASEFTSLVETLLDASHELPLLQTWGPSWDADHGADFTVVVPSATASTEEAYTRSAALMIDALRTPLGQWVAGMWRNNS